nr:reverse transcriptase domain-containing protein [Tanacetum cinerariifolium]
MRTRNSYHPNNPSVTSPRRRNRRCTQIVVEPELRTIVEVAPMTDNRTMEELLQRPTEGFEESLGEAWKRFKEMPRACGNLLSKTIREALNIIENKSKVRYSQNKPNVSRMNTNSRENSSKTDDRIDKIIDQISTLVDIVSKKVVTPATVKAVEEPCVICGGPHPYYNCIASDNNQSSVCAATVVDFDPDPRVLLILGRSFLRIGHALIDIYGEEITLWVNDEAVTFNLNQTTRYSSTYDDMSVNRTDVIDVASEEYAQEVLRD